MKAVDHHHCRVIGSPWAGVYCTGIDSGRHYGRHWHATFGVGLVEQGAHRSASGRGTVDAYAGDLVTTNPGEVHDGRPLGGPSRRWRIVCMDPEVMAAMSGCADAGLEITRPVLRDPALGRSLQRLFARLEAWSSHRAETMACEESLVDVCGLLLERHTTRAAPAQAVRGDVQRARQRLADDLQQAPTLAELAAMSGLSRYQLLRRFEQAYGLPPHAWLLAQRAEKARSLIRGGTSLSMAAASSGFADQSHMTRIFVRQFGFTPGAFRHASRRPQ
ncbi:AraC family transcriptional regulator [Piscinibacter sp. XHJ-5]|uniref:AraC family transcriptional regulator n=1 Tax=Piscinibacter sp. XHJ-5 TaxID=3037797 RepID=UPI002452D061|nr:AraC family transcriptional regulator [Piscinibacter sp. XHJ-5]